MWKVGFVPYSTSLKWIVPYSGVLNLNCALFQYCQSKLCLNPMTQNLSVPYSNIANLNCALIQCPKIEVCLIPMSHNEFCLIPKPSIWNVPYSNTIKLNSAVFWRKVLLVLKVILRYGRLKFFFFGPEEKPQRRLVLFSL